MLGAWPCRDTCLCSTAWIFVKHALTFYFKGNLETNITCSGPGRENFEVAASWKCLWFPPSRGDVPVFVLPLTSLSLPVVAHASTAVTDSSTLPFSPLTLPKFHARGNLTYLNSFPFIFQP